MANRNSDPYDPTTIALHWMTAFLVLLLWIIGQTADWLPRGPIRGSYWSLHVVLGFVLTALLIWRVWWRASAGRRLPPSDTGLLHLLASATHHLLYTLLVVVLGLGVINAFVRGYSIFGLFHLPAIGDPEWRHPLTHWHALAADAILIVAMFHAAAALMHHYVWRDGLLGRMIPMLAPPKAAE